MSEFTGNNEIIKNAFIQFINLAESTHPLPPTPVSTPPKLTRQDATIIETIDVDLCDIFDPPFRQHFGILKIKLNDTPITKQPQLIKFTVDMSGSMQDMCGDGRTKMQHSNHITINILRLAAESESKEGTEIWIQVDAFDDHIETIIEPQRVTPEKLPDLIAKINGIYPRNSTNIELALNDSNTKIAQFLELHPNFSVTHIFTTDGQSNVGVTDDTQLTELVCPLYSNIFIGLGLDHSASTLSAFSTKKHACYYFIDKIENGGLVFGEVIHGILYQALTDIVIEVSNAEIYDYKTNQWSEKLTIDSLTGEAEKTYHLRTRETDNVDDVEARIVGTRTQTQTPTHLAWVYNVPALECDDGTVTPPLEVMSKYVFRQRTQELLYEAKQNGTRLDIRGLKSKLKNFLSLMKSYMEKNSLTEDPTFQSLNDDIVIVLQTLGTSYQTMYTSARINSNGREQSYNVGAPRVRNHGRGPHFRRQMAFDDGSQFQDTADEDEQMQEFNLMSRVPLSRTHTTPRQIALMRSCSEGTQATEILDLQNPEDEDQDQPDDFDLLKTQKQA